MAQRQVSLREREEESMDDEVTIVGRGRRDKKGEAAVKQEDVGELEVARPYPCPYGCTGQGNGPWEKRNEMLRHLCNSGNHHKDALRGALPDASLVRPFRCPLCLHEHRDIASLTRHYGLACNQLVVMGLEEATFVHGYSSSSHSTPRPKQKLVMQV